jgi:hypothetical protein
MRTNAITDIHPGLRTADAVTLSLAQNWRAANRESSRKGIFIALFLDNDCTLIRNMYPFALQGIRMLSLVGILISSACSAPKHDSDGPLISNQRPASAFFLQSRLENIVKQSLPELADCMVDGNENSFGNNQVHYSRSSSVYCQIKPLNKTSFDQKALLPRLKIEVEKTVEAAGARIVGGRYESPDSFNFEYVSGDRRGWVDIVVARAEAGHFSLILVMHEIPG